AGGCAAGQSASAVSRHAAFIERRGRGARAVRRRHNGPRRHEPVQGAQVDPRHVHELSESRAPEHEVLSGRSWWPQSETARSDALPVQPFQVTHSETTLYGYVIDWHVASDALLCKKHRCRDGHHVGVLAYDHGLQVVEPAQSTEGNDQVRA